MRVHRTSEVLVVGAGLVGLSTAIALRRYGIAVRVVERHSGTSIQPKARRFNFRTMEVFRSLGISAEVADAARGLADHQGFRAGRTLVEAEPLPPPPTVDFSELAVISPEPSCLVAQDVLEPVLLRIARELGARVDFDTALVDLVQDGHGVTARLAGGTDDRTDHLADHLADYLVAADGSRSTVRELLGIPRSGAGPLGRAVTVLFDADLGPLTRGREFNLCQVDHPTAPGAFASVDGVRRWMFYTGELLPVDAPADAWSQLVRTALGRDTEVRIRSVQAWEPAVLVADRFVAGRVLLAGDAAHVMPPYAALGANTGIQDAANLAWKVAAALRGEAGTGLLATYHTERHAAGRYAAEQSAARSAQLTGAGTASTTADGSPVAHPFALVAGYRYPAGAVLDRCTDPHPMDRLQLTGRPGTRVPHAWLPDGRSTLDVAGLGFGLLTGPAGDEWVRAAGAVGLPAAQLPGYCVDAGALLVRPDQIVGWAAPEAAEGAGHDPVATLRDVLDRIHRLPEPAAE